MIFNFFKTISCTYKKFSKLQILKPATKRVISSSKNWLALLFFHSDITVKQKVQYKKNNSL